jgi:hypothetical protein
MTTAQKITQNGWNITKKSNKPAYEQRYAGTASDTVRTESKTAIRSQRVERRRKWGAFPFH